MAIKLDEKMFNSDTFTKGDIIACSGMLNSDSESNCIIEKASNITQISKIKVNLEKIQDGLRGNWWYHIASRRLKFIEQIPVIDCYPVEIGDFLIHKYVVPGDRFPTTRYHEIVENGMKMVESPRLKEVLSERKDYLS